MIRFGLIGRLELVQPLGAELVRLGAELETGSTHLILVGASTLAEARAWLDNMPESERRKTVVVGLDEYLDFHPVPAAGSYGAFLETYRLLGVMPPGLLTRWDNFGFVGAMRVARKMKLWFGGPSHSPTYAIWAGLNDFPNAAVFLKCLVELLEREGRAEAADEPT